MRWVTAELDSRSSARVADAPGVFDARRRNGSKPPGPRRFRSHYRVSMIVIMPLTCKIPAQPRECGQPTEVKRWEEFASRSGAEISTTSTSSSDWRRLLCERLKQISAPNRRGVPSRRLRSWRPRSARDAQDHSRRSLALLISHTVFLGRRQPRYAGVRSLRLRDCADNFPSERLGAYEVRFAQLVRAIRRPFALSDIGRRQFEPPKRRTSGGAIWRTTKASRSGIRRCRCPEPRGIVNRENFFAGARSWCRISGK